MSHLLLLPSTLHNQCHFHSSHHHHTITLLLPLLTHSLSHFHTSTPPTPTHLLISQVMLPTGEERVVNVDTAISSEHARVEFDVSTGQFFICDGTPSKPSTNGTWYR